MHIGLALPASACLSGASFLGKATFQAMTPSGMACSSTAITPLCTAPCTLFTVEATQATLHL